MNVGSFITILRYVHMFIDLVQDSHWRQILLNFIKQDAESPKLPRRQKYPIYAHDNRASGAYRPI